MQQVFEHLELKDKRGEILILPGYTNTSNEARLACKNTDFGVQNLAIMEGYSCLRLFSSLVGLKPNNAPCQEKAWLNWHNCSWLGPAKYGIDLRLGLP